MKVTDKPLAVAGIISYRCKGGYGWIMIGAKNHADAIVQANRSSDMVKPETLEMWDGNKYASVSP